MPFVAILTSIVTADINGDGLADLVVSGTEGFITLLGQGDGTVLTAANYQIAGGVGLLALGDLDGDGIPDLVAAVGSALTFLKGQGDGFFTPGDGKPDMVTANVDTSDASVLLNTMP